MGLDYDNMTDKGGFVKLNVLDFTKKLNTVLKLVNRITRLSGVRDKGLILTLHSFKYIIDTGDIFSMN